MSQSWTINHANALKCITARISPNCQVSQKVHLLFSANLDMCVHVCMHKHIFRCKFVFNHASADNFHNQMQPAYFSECIV